MMKRLLCCLPLLFAVLPASLLACDAKRPEPLAGFFEQFLNDKRFAVSRTLYPAQRVHYRYGLQDGKQEITESRRSMIKLEDAKYPPLGDYIRSMGFAPALRQTSPTNGVARLSRTDGGWLLDYQFSLKDGCWYLREIQHHAL